MEGGFGFGQQSLWIGDIDATMTENMVRAAFPPSAGVVGVKFVRDKSTGYPAGYGFVEFSSPAAAQQALRLYNGSPIPGTPHTLNPTLLSTERHRRGPCRGSTSPACLLMPPTPSSTLPFVQHHSIGKIVADHVPQSCHK